MRHRSWRFDSFLKDLQSSDPARYKRILAAERNFMDTWVPKLAEEERIFAEQMEGWQDTPEDG